MHGAETFRLELFESGSSTGIELPFIHPYSYIEEQDEATTIPEVPAYYRSLRLLPIHQSRLEKSNPTLIDIHVDEVLKRAEDKTRGSAFGVICTDKNNHPWMTKIGFPQPDKFRPEDSIGTQFASTMNLGTITEKIAMDIYTEMGSGVFITPTTKLCILKINAEWRELLEIHDSVIDCMRVCSKFVTDFSEFGHVKVRVPGSDATISFQEYVVNSKAPPEKIVAPTEEGQEPYEVPLYGFVELLAVARMLSDVDVLGNGAMNAGVQWQKDDKGKITAAVTVKLDPGYAFEFHRRFNMVVNTERNKPFLILQDLKDIQLGTFHQDFIVSWEHLSREQKDCFLSTMINCFRYQTVLDFFFFRDGRFLNENARNCLPKSTSEELKTSLLTWMEKQRKLYKEDIEYFEKRNPDFVLKLYYLDSCANITLPMSKDSYPVSDMFTDLAISPTETENHIVPSVPEDGNIEIDPNKIANAQCTLGSQTISLNQLFGADQTTRSIKKILIVGSAGVGKSSLCQKIAHECTSGKLFPQFRITYWIPLRCLSSFTKNNKDLPIDEFIAKALSTVILNRELTQEFLAQFQSEKRVEILLILDGYDETDQLLRTKLDDLLKDNSLHVIVTTRPGHLTESKRISKFQRVVENQGFRGKNISQYASRFFGRDIDRYYGEEREREREKADRLTKSFQNAIDHNSAMAFLAQTPLQCQILCLLWEEDRNSNSADQKLISMTRLYSRVVENLYSWESKRRNKDPAKMKEGKRKELVATLCKIAVKLLKQGTLFFKEDEMRDMLPDSVAFGDLEILGLLSHTDLATSRSYQFLHLSFQEFIIAQYFVDRKKNSKGEYDNTELRKFITKRRHDAKYSLTITFIAGLLWRSRQKFIKTFFQLLCKDLTPENIKGIHLKNILLALNECIKPKTGKSNPKDFLGAIDPLENLLSNPEVLEIEIDGEPLVIWCCKSGLLHSLKWLVKRKGVDVLKQKNAKGWSVFTYPVLQGQKEIMQWLCQRKLCVDQPVLEMCAAIVGGRTFVVEWLIDIEKKLEEELFFTLTLWLSVIIDKLDIIKWILEKREKLFEQLFSCEDTLLHISAQFSSLGTFQWILGQLPEAAGMVNAKGQSLMHKAVSNFPVLAWLCSQEQFQYQLRCKDIYSRTPLFSSTLVNLRTVQYIYEKLGNDPKHLKSRSNTLLHFLAARGSVDIIKWVHAQDASLIHKTDASGLKPLDLAIVFNNTEGVELILSWMDNTDNMGFNHAVLLIYIMVEQPLDSFKLVIRKFPLIVKQVFKLPVEKIGLCFSGTLFEAAIVMDRLDIVQFLLSDEIISHTPLTDQNPSKDMMIQAINFATEPLWKELYKIDPESISRGVKGERPVSIAISCGNVDALKWIFSINEELFTADDRANIKKSKKDQLVAFGNEQFGGSCCIC